ncbi:MAG: hypothetical protein WCP20_05170 [Desulfuromonadales bacterium]
MNKKFFWYVMKGLLAIVFLATNVAAVTYTYQYDDLQRLISVAKSDGTVSTIYTYNEAGNRTRKVVTVTATPDTIKPVVTNFTAPPSATSLTVTGIIVTATDAGGVTGYLLTEDSTAPLPSAAGWSASVTQFTFASAGSKTLYAWAKDAAGNVSAVYTPVSISIVDNATPTITSFTVPATSTSVTVTGISMAASDNFAVTGYKLTENSTKPNAGDAGWSGSEITSYTFTSGGSKTLYVWSKDASGNVSDLYTSRLVTITLPLPSTPTGLSVQYQAGHLWNYISWGAAANATDYKVYWGTSPGVTASSNAMPLTQTTDFGHSGVVAGTTYYYRVAAVNNNGASALSTEVSVTVPPTTQYGTLNVTASSGSDIYTPALANYQYRYGASIILNGNTFDMWTAAPNPGLMDLMTHRRGTVDSSGNVQWLTNWTTALLPTPNSEDHYSICDPSVVYFNGYYYVGYTSTKSADGKVNQVFVARCSALPDNVATATCEKWNGSGWGGNPQPIIKYTGTGWGKGQPSFVVKDNLLYIYYTDGGTKVVTVDATNANWPALVNEAQAATVLTNAEATVTLGGKPGPFEAKYIDKFGKFIGLGVSGEFGSGSNIYVYESLDGLSFQPIATSKSYWGAAPLQNFAHNIGISGDSAGHLNADSAYNFVAYGVGLPASQTDAQGYKAKWPTHLNLVSVMAPVGVDSEKPVITNFTIPATSNSLTVTISSLSATDNVNVIGYMLTESSTAPGSGDSGWSSSLTQYTFTSAGSKMLYAWAKDAASNVSNVFTPANVTILLLDAGVCGAANGQLFAVAPTTDLCAPGFPSVLPSGNGPWSWICKSFSGGADSPTCNATQQTANNLTLLFQDDFNDNSLNTALWTPHGTSVIESGGILSLQENVTDTNASVTSRIALTPAIRIELRHYMHTPNNYFHPSISFNYKDNTGTDAGIIGISWKKSAYAPDYCNVPNGYDKVMIGCVISNITSSTLHDKWITSYITFDSTTGVVDYDVGGDGTIDFSVTIPEASRHAIDSFSISGYGWFTGMYHNIDWIRVYTAPPVNYSISGNVAAAGATLSYTDGTTKTAISDASGNYSFTVSNKWSGTVTVSKVGYTFTPSSKIYTNVTSNQTAQNYTNVPITFTFPPVSIPSGNGTVSCTGPVSYNASSTCTITPVNGYRLDSLTDNAVNVMSSVSGNTYIINNVTSIHNITATFVLQIVPGQVTASVQAGSNISVILPPAANLNFTTVTTPGTVQLTTTAGPGANVTIANGTGFSTVLGTSYDITSTAGSSGSITVCIAYNPANITVNENILRLLHNNGTAWEDITTSVDTVNDKVCGQTTSLSSFVIGYRKILKSGDCDGNGSVTIDEVQSAINMYLGLKTPAACVDINGDGVTIDEVQKVINGYLEL